MLPNRSSIPSWQWNQYLITLASFTTFAGFTFFSPFFPIFVHRELGIESLAEIAFWSGVLVAAPPLLSALSGPFWGRIADRYGYRAMVQRAILTFVLVVGLMAFVTNIWELLILRMLSGLLGGFNAMGMALITNVTPKDRTAQAVGLFQGARTFSNAFGPLVGGTLAALIGMRPTFAASAVAFIIAFIMLRMFWRDDAPEAAAPQKMERPAASLWSAACHQMPERRSDRYITRRPSGVHSGRSLEVARLVSRESVAEARSYIHTSARVPLPIDIATRRPSGESRG